MNKLMMTRTLTSTILRSNFSTAARRQGMLQNYAKHAEKQAAMQRLPGEVHKKTGVDRASFNAAMVMITGTFAFALNRCYWLAYKK